jgi:hypothetical protein
MWQRLGVVFSVLWSLGAGLWQRSQDVDRAGQAMSAMYRACSAVRASKGDFNFAPCMVQANEVFQNFLSGSWGNVAITALAPIIAGWLLVYLVILVVRWVLAGRSAGI